MINFKNSDFCKLLRLPISPILKIQKFPLGILILSQKSFYFPIPRLKTPQPVLPYFKCIFGIYLRMSTLLSIIIILLLCRYLGTTPNSSSLAPLLTSICQQLSYTFMLPFEDIPEDLVPLTAHMKELLTHVIFSPYSQKLFKVHFSFRNHY